MEEGDGKKVKKVKKKVKKKSAGAEGDADGGKKIPSTPVDAGASEAPAAAAGGEPAGPVRMEGCGPCKRAVPDVPLSDAGRTSRDLLCAAFFIAFAIGDLVIALIGFQQGQPQALIYGLDYAGNVCGRNNQVREQRSEARSEARSAARTARTWRHALARTRQRACPALGRAQWRAGAAFDSLGLRSTRRQQRRAPAPMQSLAAAAGRTSYTVGARARCGQAPLRRRAHHPLRSLAFAHG
jgi:hypothetical protein